MNDDIKTAIVATMTYLMNNVDSDYRTVLQEALEDDALVESNIQRMRSSIPENAEIVGAIGVGTGILREEIGIPADIASEAVRVMKDLSVIQQCGRGRGKALLILRNNFVLDGDYFVWNSSTGQAVDRGVEAADENPTPTESPEPTDVSTANQAVTLRALVERVDDAMQALSRYVDALGSTDPADLASQLAEARREIEEQRALAW